MPKILLNKKNYFHNLDLICQKTEDSNKVAIVLNDNAYGHVLFEIDNLENEYAIKKSMARNLQEALEIEKLFDDILILADTHIHTYSHSFHVAINCLEDIFKIPPYTKVHLKVDSGMNKNGIHKITLKEPIYGLYKQNIQQTGIFTHQRNADKVGTDFYWENRDFLLMKKEVKKLCEQLSLTISTFHCDTASSLFRFKNFEDNWTQIHIKQYGYLESKEAFNLSHLKPKMSLGTKKLCSRKIEQKKEVSHGATFKGKNNITICNYEPGYIHGFLHMNEQDKYVTPKKYPLKRRVSQHKSFYHYTKEEML